MSIKTDAVVIRDETTTGANTAARVGTNLVDIADDLTTKQSAISLNTSKISYTDAAAVALNTAKVSNIAHPLVEKAVPSNAVFTDTVYDDTAIQAEVDLNTAKDLSTKQDTLVSGTNIKTINGESLLGATDIIVSGTPYDDSDVLKDADTVSPVTGVNKIITESDVAALGGGDMLASVYDPVIDANTAKVSNVDHPLVETAVPVGAVFTDNDTIYDDTAIQAEVDLNTAKVGITTQQAADIVTNNAKETNIAHPLVEEAVPSGALFTDTVYDDTAIQAEVTANTAKVSFDSTSSTRLANTSGTNTGDQVLTGLDYEPTKGVDDNYVTDAEKVVIGNTSNTNTGDNAVNTLYSGLTGVTTEEANTIDSEPIGNENQVLQVVSITQANYDLITPVATTLYVING